MSEDLQGIEKDVIKKTSGLAIASLVLALSCLGSWLGIILGIVALVKIGDNPRLGGKGLAIAGIAVGGALTIMLFFIPFFAAITIPSLLRSQMSSNETATVGALRTLVASQAQFRGAVVVDQDGDGVGEYGYFQELAGAANPRTVGNQIPTDVRPGEYATQVLGIVSREGIVMKNDYCFKMFLPSTSGPAGETSPLPAGSAEDADLQEQAFICYAWPVAFDSSGKRCFVVNQRGDVFTAKNSDSADNPIYDGVNKIPDATAAFFKDDENARNFIGNFPDIDNGEQGNDGQIWVPAAF